MRAPELLGRKLLSVIKSEKSSGRKLAQLDGKVAIITGAAKGMGKAHARRFVAEGASVFLSDVNAEAGTRLSEELGNRVSFVALDVTDESAWTAAAAVAAAEARFKPVTVLVNNAGISALARVRVTCRKLISARSLR